MEDYIIRFAGIEDHPRLVDFYSTYYKPGHPLYDTSFWKWQYGNAETGRCIIATKEDGEIIGHIGCSFGGGMVWLINILINKAYRGQGLPRIFFDRARVLGPIAGAVVNAAGQSILVRKKWYRYADLLRFVLVNPAVIDQPISNWVRPIELPVPLLEKPGGHYFRQPGIDGITLRDGSTAVVQKEVGGLRMVDLHDITSAAKQAWEMGFLWVDYIASWNHPLVYSLQKNGWKTDSGLPWYLNPVDHNMKIVLNLFSEEPIPRDFLFHRSYADLGRVGKISDLSTKAPA